MEDERRLVAPRVLIADPEPALAELLALGLRDFGLLTAVARDGHEALASISTWLPELLVIDPELGAVAGLEVVRRVRALPGPRIGIVVATGDHDRLQGFAAGADDEMLKPLALEELAVRLHAIYERSREPSGEPESLLTHGELTIDIARRRVEVAGRVVDLRRREFDLLAFLARRPGEVFTRGELVAQVWRAPDGVDLSTVTVHMHRLRMQLEA